MKKLFMKKSGFYPWMKRMLKNLDIYGINISLTYDNRSTFQSLKGGLLTMATAVLILAYLANGITKVKDRVSNVSSMITYKSSIDDSDVYVVNTTNIDFMFQYVY
jgi:hypothetical protein